MCSGSKPVDDRISILGITGIYSYLRVCLAVVMFYQAAILHVCGAVVV